MRLNNDMMEEVDFRLAQIEFCLNNFDTANVQFQRLLVEYPSVEQENSILGHYAAGRDPRELSGFDLKPVMTADYDKRPSTWITFDWGLPEKKR